MELQGIQTEDMFREIGNVGTGSCMASLSHMTGEAVRYSSPELVNLEYNSLSDWCGSAGENIVGVLIPFAGDVQGMVLQLYKVEMVKAILKGVLGQDAEQEELDGRRLDLLREVANIMASTYLTAFASYTGCRIVLSGSAVSMDMTGAILTEFIGSVGSADEMLCMRNQFFLKEKDSRILVVMQELSVRKFLEALEVAE